jgi:GAF domain-containing protein
MFPLVVDDVVPFEDWTAAARASLGFLHRTVGLDAWMVTQVQPPQQVVLLSHPFGAVPSGTTVPFAQSFCQPMVTGAGPRVATVAAVVPAYRDLVTAHGAAVAAYVGVPLVTRSGGLFGTLCGVADRAQPRSLSRHLPLVEMTARMLSTLLPGDL